MTETYADGGLVLSPERIATLSLNRPARRNAMTRSMWQALPEICDRIAKDKGIRVLIVHGTGGKAFCAGADISEFEQTYATVETTADYNAIIRQAQARLRDLPCVTLAAISGVCFGGGCGVALACDLRFADESASFAITPARLGLAYSPADTWQLIEKVGVSPAKDMLLSGRVLPPDEALRFGLIDRLSPDSLSAARTYATDLERLAPAALRANKAIINGLSLPSLEPRLQAIFEACFSGPEFREGRRAFLEKRPANFTADLDEASE